MSTYFRTRQPQQKSLNHMAEAYQMDGLFNLVHRLSFFEVADGRL